MIASLLMVSACSFWLLEISSSTLETLQIYKIALGRKLNLSKSILITFNLAVTISWVKQTGCIINGLEDINKCLGAPWGTSIPPSQHYSFCINKIGVKLVWVLRTLIKVGAKLVGGSSQHSSYADIIASHPYISQEVY